MQNTLKRVALQLPALELKCLWVEETACGVQAAEAVKRMVERPGDYSHSFRPRDLSGAGLAAALQQVNRLISARVIEDAQAVHAVTSG